LLGEAWVDSRERVWTLDWLWWRLAGEDRMSDS
jgi:hypothetical protein